ncbi:MAG: DpnII family type II restriction endonuclease [Candidatus Omnitrophota bacterium]
MNYVDFASKISFFEFTQSEFKKPHFKINDYSEEIDILKAELNIETLTKLFETHPKLIDIFKEIFQLKRFTNTQFIHFCFDVNVLNNYDDDSLLNHIDNSILKFENGKLNEYFVNIYDKESQQLKSIDKIYCVKKSIVEYIDKFANKKYILYNHLQNSIGARYRLSKYLIENLNAKEYLSALDLKRYLMIKRHPKDTKGIHGNFGTVKIIKILDDNNVISIDDIVDDRILTDKIIIPEKDFNKFCYVREKAINGIIKKKDNKPKVFDFIIFYKGRPVILIETNFYTTAGTKIGINQGEYTDLLKDIEKYNAENNINYKFIWITDGNYWLSSDGKNRFTNLKNNYFKNEYELLNYNLFKSKLKNLLNVIKNEF